MKKTDPLFLLKFGLNEVYADSIVEKNEIYTNCSRYFIMLDRYNKTKGLGDEREGLLLNCITKFQNCPLYCLYSLNSNDIILENNKIYAKINQQFYNEFCTNDKNWCVVFKGKEFIDKIMKTFKDIYGLKLGPIKYGCLSYEDQAKLVVHDPKAESIFIKRKNFDYQNEYRLLLQDPFEDTLINCEECKMVYYDGTEYKGKSYQINGLNEISYKKQIENPIIKDDYILIDITETNQ